MMYMTSASISPSNNQQQQQSSSPSDNQSMSTATPPSHQNISRASPASTALVMSSNNINNQQGRHANSSSTNTSPSTSQNGTGSSSNGNTGINHHQQQQQAPNPMARQFACHAKSMSAGVVVSVPGISNNLATAAGMNQNNMVNNNIIGGGHTHHVNRNSQPQHLINHNPLDPSGAHPHPQPHPHSHRIQQQVIREHHHHQRNHHHHQPSSISSHQQQQQQQQQQFNQNQNHNQINQASSQMSSSCLGGGGGSTRQQATSSSIILSSSNLNNLHSRSASTHLSNVLLSSSHHHHHHNNNMNNQNNHHHHSTSNHHLTANSRNSNYNSSHANVTNSIWGSIDENISKSHNKLSSSNYLPEPYLFHSIGDMSCDNVSNISRLIDGQPTGPAPGYYQIHPAIKKHASSSNVMTNQQTKMPEFLPICDLMFNLISMILYFCDNTFGIIALIALYYHTTFYHWALMGTVFVVFSNFVCQYLSYKWLYQVKLDECRRKQEAEEELEEEEGYDRNRYYHRRSASLNRDYPTCGSCSWLPDRVTELHVKFLLSIALDAIMHLFCLGFLVRYIKLVIPVTDTARVKREARDLCLLRMIHGFVQSAPLLLLQAYMIYSQAFTSSPITNLSVTSALLSLINVCWALASFTKYSRKKYMHKFVLTWLGILSQLLWRLGTISSRVVALTIYAVYYNYWMLIVLALHWLTMFLWFIKPGNPLRDEENLTKTKKTLFAAAAAWIHCFCFVNFEEDNSKLKMTTFYLIVFLENNLLLTVCLIFSPQVTWFKNLSILVVYLGFVTGMLFMFLYYKYFHVNVLNNGLSCSQESVDSIADQLSAAGKKIAGFKPGTLRLKSEDNLQTTTSHRYHNNINGALHTGSQPEIARTNNKKPPYLTHQQAPLPQSGVFNCKLNTGSRNKQILQNSHPKPQRRHNQ